MDNNNRRHFLKKSIISGIGAMLLPATLKSEICPKPTNQTPSPLTTADYYGQGPFYTPNAPQLHNATLANDTEEGEVIIINGYVIDATDATPIPNTEIDIWHANSKGSYDNNGYNLRGKTVSDANGFYSFKTIKPGYYLNGSNYRPAHIHFKINPPNSPSLITQLYFENDPYIENDAAASIESGTFNASHRIIPLIENEKQVKEGCWNIVFDIDETTIGLNHNLNRGAIYNIYALPNSTTLFTEIGLFEPASAIINIIDSKGNSIETITLESLPTGKHKLQFNLKSNYSKGIYIAQLIINQKQTRPIRFTIL